MERHDMGMGEAGYDRDLAQKALGGERVREIRPKHL
jgi:hypothetical protein